MQRTLELITLPLRTMVLLFLLGLAYYFGYGTPVEESREQSGSGVIARYTRDGRPWRSFYDRDGDRKWDKWIDERNGLPYIVSIDDDHGGRADRDEDDSGAPLSAWRSSQLRAMKTAGDLLHNPRQWQYLGLAVLLYTFLELSIRSFTKDR
jgi:hypothetical protein